MAIASVQTPVGNFSVAAGTTIAKAYTSNVTAGSVLVALFLWGNATQTGTVSGSLNGAFTAVASSLATQASGPFRAEVFYKTGASAGAETVTGTSSGSNSQRELVIYELSGVDIVNIPDSQVGANGTSTNPTTTVTTVAQPGWIIAYCAATAGTVTVGSGYTSDLSQNGDLGQHKAYAATGSTSIPFVDASSSNWLISAAAFREGAGGGGGTVVKNLAALGVG